MKALIKENGITELKNINYPVIDKNKYVLVKIILSGICRTDRLVAENAILTPHTIILGHESVGEVIQSSGHGISTGELVCISPIQSCKDTPCGNVSHYTCQNSRFMGLNYNGSFTEYIVVPESSVYRIPKNINHKKAIFFEPVAAALSILNTGIRPRDNVLILGHSRIAILAHRILKYLGYNNCFLETNQLTSEYDFIVETDISNENIFKALLLLKQHGTLIIKSKFPQELALPLQELQKKEITIKFANYGSFDQALKLIIDDNFFIEDLYGEIFDLADFNKAFYKDSLDQTKKIFLTSIA